MESPISIYAELLPNIRQTSVAVTLHTPADASTSGRVTHSDNSSVVLIQHSGSTTSLTLPARVAVPDNYRLPIIPNRLEWRLPVAADDVRTDGGTTVPWESKDLVVGGQVTCRKCDAVLVREGVVGVWKDLPAEGWAEMMEFWHCHKPGEEHHHHHGDGDGGAHSQGNGHAKADEKTLASRGYGADSTITAQSGVGFVDLTTFLFVEKDCEGIKSSTPQHVPTDEDCGNNIAISSLNVHCQACSAQVGYENHKTGGLTIFKWAITIPVNLFSFSPPPPQPRAEECISSILSATKARTGSSKCLLLPIPRTEPVTPGWTQKWKDLGLLVQILIPSITYSSSLSASSGAVPAMKVLFRYVQREEMDRMLEDVNSDVQEVNLAWEEISLLLARPGPLTESTLLLPKAQRSFLGCTVGMLRRWEV